MHANTKCRVYYLPVDIFFDKLHLEINSPGFNSVPLCSVFFFFFSCHCGAQNQSEDWIKKQQFNYNPNLSFTESNPQIQSNRCHFNDRNVLTRFVFLVMFVFAPLP